VVIAADPSRGAQVCLPWDYLKYGIDPDSEQVVNAAIAAMAIPDFFEPVRIHSNGRTSTLADRGVIGDYPIAIFDRIDGKPPRWPTIGILAVGPERTGTQSQLSPEDDRRTINIPDSGVGSTSFAVSDAQKFTLYEAGRAAAQRFLGDTRS